MVEQSKTCESESEQSVLNKKNSFLCGVFIICSMILFCSVGFVFSSYAVNVSTLKILSLIENKRYLKASRILEKELARTRDKKTKGHYALLLNQIPRGVPMKRARHEYTIMAARWAKNIPVKKRMQLWIEAGDGFFKMAELAKADISYKKAFSLAFKYKAQSEMSYVLYKRAWVQINEKEWIKAFYFLEQALEKKKEKNRLKENILSDMGQIWVESQYFKKRIPFANLEADKLLAPLAQKRIVVEGMVKGINRIRKKGINKVVSVFSTNQKLSTEILNQILSKKTSIIPSCDFLFWMEKVKMKELNRDKSLSILNTCTKFLTSKKRKSRTRKEQIQKIANLYAQVERKGLERWPLIRIYEYMEQTNEACGESLHQLVETTDSRQRRSQKVKMKETFMESFRLCKKAKTAPVFSEKAIKALLSSNRIIRNYKTTEGEWENTLFHLLDMKLFYPVIRKNILKFDTNWKGKDLLPLLLLSNIQDYQPKEIKGFLNLFSPKPVKSYYLDVLLSEDFLTVAELQKWLPLSGVASYRETIPWFKKMVSEKLSMEQKQRVVAKMLKHFPSEEKDRREVSLFLSLHYLKTDQVTEIFQHWNLLSSVFNKKKSGCGVV